MHVPRDERLELLRLVATELVENTELADDIEGIEELDKELLLDEEGLSTLVYSL